MKRPTKAAVEPAAADLTQWVPVEPSPNRVVGYADKAVAGLTMTRDVELYFLRMQGAPTRHGFTPVQIEGEDMMSSGSVEVRPQIMDIAAIRMDPAAALDMATVVIAHLRRHSLIDDAAITAAVAAQMAD